MMPLMRSFTSICFLLLVLTALPSFADDPFIQFGTTGTNAVDRNVRVTFREPFAAGQRPLIFIMPTISPNNPYVNDGPATIRLQSVSSTGFTWVQREPPIQSSSSSINSQTMTNVSWVAVLPGTHTLPNGRQLVAGTRNINQALNLSFKRWESFFRSWTNVPLSSHLNVALTQMQTQNNYCWLTSVSRPYRNGIQLNLEASLVYRVSGSSQRCVPGNRQNLLTNEEVAYLALEASSGDIILNDQLIRYQFGNGRNLPTNNITISRSLDAQCQTDTRLTGFTEAPIFVGKKSTRNGAQGGWMRRCNLSSDSVSMVTDEDIYRNRDRAHVSENFGFVAFQVLQESIINHFELSYSSNPLTCQPQGVTLKACGDQACNKLYTDPVSATLSPTIASNRGGWFVNGTRTQVVTFSLSLIHI